MSAIEISVPEAESAEETVVDAATEILDTAREIAEELDEARKEGAEEARRDSINLEYVVDELVLIGAQVNAVAEEQRALREMVAVALEKLDALTALELVEQIEDAAEETAESAEETPAVEIHADTIEEAHVEETPAPRQTRQRRWL